MKNTESRAQDISVGRNGFAEDAGSEVEWIGECILSEGGQGCPSELQRKETTMSPLRARMIEDMTLAGLAEGTQRVYVQAVRGVTAHYRRSPDLLSEEEVRGYLLGLRQRGVARGTFQTSRYGLRFFYHHTLDRAWALFGGKKDRLATT
jgi:Phage integrase, N-terminal SAM-like domain